MSIPLSPTTADAPSCPYVSTCSRAIWNSSGGGENVWRIACAREGRVCRLSGCEPEEQRWPWRLGGRPGISGLRARATQACSSIGHGSARTYSCPTLDKKLILVGCQLHTVGAMYTGRLLWDTLSVYYIRYFLAS